MSKLYTSEMFVRYTHAGKSVEISWDPSVNWEEAWLLAHSNADGSEPKPPVGGTKHEATIWAHAMEIRKAEREVFGG